MGQKGILTLPSQEIIVHNNQQGLSFTLPKADAKGGNAASRAMTFGDDFNTKIFRIFVAFMIRYKLYAENQQRIGELMNPQVERFLKLEPATLRTKYRAHVSLEGVDLSNGITAQAVVRSIIPFKVDA